MSTKIYEAYRVPVATLTVTLQGLREQILERVLTRFEKLMRSVAEEHVAQTLAKDKAGYAQRGWQWREEREDWREFFTRFEAVYKYASRAREHAHSFLIFDCGFSIWIYEGWAYLIPYGSPDSTQDLQWPEDAEEYSYWNNTDRPENISNEAWNARGQTWERVNQSSSEQWEAGKLDYAVVNLDKAGSISLSYGTLMVHLRDRWHARREQEQQARQAQQQGEVTEPA